jgi:hypothetical protein
MLCKICTTGQAFWSLKWDTIKFVQCTILTFLFLLIQNVCANAADITFDPITVNVEYLKGLAGQYIGVVCEVRDSNNNVLSTQATGGGPHPHEGTLDAEGTFSGTLSHARNFLNPNDFFKAKFYKCYLWARQGSISTAVVIGDGTTWYHAKSGNLSVTGPIP